jgi:FSR family fosmidomycin resistance protein-like MFS transporter
MKVFGIEYPFLQETITQETASAPLAVPAEVIPTGSRQGLISKTLLLLALAHMTVDLFSSAVPTLQPLLTERFSLSLSQSGLLSGVFMLASAVMQLPFGVLSDRLNSRLFTVLTPLAAGFFLSSLPSAIGFKSLLLLVALGGMGVAAFHPQSTTQAAAVSKERSGLSVALFFSSGMLGFGLGPAYFSLITTQVGFEWLFLGMAPGVIVSLILFAKLPPPARRERSAVVGFDAHVPRAARGPLALHYALVVLRSVVQLGLGQFLTLYLYKERGFTFAEASFTLTLFFLSATAGSLLGGNLADRFGSKRIVVASMIGSVPFLWLFLATDGWISLLSLFAGGLTLLLTIPVNVVMAQKLVPSKAGTITAVMMGFAWGMVGITCIPLIGWLADRVGLQAVLFGVVTAPLAGFLLALRLPSDSPAGLAD